MISAFGAPRQGRRINMSKLEDLQPNASVQGILQNCLVTVVSTQWFGSEALELTYKDPGGKVANELLYRHDEPRIEIAARGRPWSFDGGGQLFRRHCQVASSGGAMGKTSSAGFRLQAQLRPHRATCRRRHGEPCDSGWH